MNSTLKVLLRKSIIVFYFLQYIGFSASVEQYAAHLTIIFYILHTHQLKSKPFKCLFGQSSITYLGHIISADGVTVDSLKISAITDWPTPSNTCAFRGFLGLAVYYHKFVYNF